MSHLVPCLSCQRHVRASDERCPFCDTALSPEQRTSAPPRLPGKRLGRAALFTFGATLMGAAACSSGSSGGTDAGNDVPVVDSGTGSGGSGSGGATGSGGSGTGGATGSGGSGTGGATGTGGTDAGNGDARDTGGSGGIAPPYGIGPLYGAPATDE